MDGQENSPGGPSLTRRVAKEADPAQVADAMAATWRDIDAALVPIVGRLGVAALYKRSLYLASSAHPWLSALGEGDHTTIDLAALKSVVGQQAGADAALGANAFLQTFYQLLGSLVGPALTERLLRSVWADSPGGPPAQDTTP
jgi:hypothetical protein